ncbi:hypothetical protein [Streptomyces massasporeus]|uniref:hypothetical protein n=1 Tax=Streptomyces massasporeus TaxID=67324 RepID=UPI003D9F8553
MAEVPLWWAALTALWLVFAGTVDPLELAVGAGAPPSSERSRPAPRDGRWAVGERLDPRRHAHPWRSRAP